jgi:hypothetical protein
LKLSVNWQAEFFDGLQIDLLERPLGTQVTIEAANDLKLLQKLFYRLHCDPLLCEASYHTT